MGTSDRRTADEGQSVGVYQLSDFEGQPEKMWKERFIPRRRREHGGSRKGCWERVGVLSILLESEEVGP